MLTAPVSGGFAFAHVAVAVAKAGEPFERAHPADSPRTRSS